LRGGGKSRPPAIRATNQNTRQQTRINRQNQRRRTAERMMEERGRRRSSSESTQDGVTSPRSETKTPTRPASSGILSPSGSDSSYVCRDCRLDAMERKSSSEQKSFGGLSPPDNAHRLSAAVRVLRLLLLDQFGEICNQRGLYGAGRREAVTRYADGVYNRCTEILNYDVDLVADARALRGHLHGGGKDPVTPPKTSRKRLRAEEKEERELEELKQERRESQRARVGSPGDHARMARQATERANRGRIREDQKTVERKTTETMTLSGDWFPVWYRMVEVRVRDLITLNPNITIQKAMTEAKALIEKTHAAQRAAYGLPPDPSTSEKRHTRLPASTRGEPGGGWRSGRPGPSAGSSEESVSEGSSVERPVDLTATLDAEGSPIRVPHPLHESTLNYGAGRLEANILLEARLRNNYMGEVQLMISAEGCSQFFVYHDRLQMLLNLLASSANFEEELEYTINHISHDRSIDDVTTLECLELAALSDDRWLSPGYYDPCCYQQ
jgi:hypothetical protein